MAYKDPFDERARAARRKHYQNNKQQYYDRAMAKKAELREHIIAQKDKPCADCGIKYPYYVMQFDHLGDKEYTISKMASLGSKTKIDKEIAKCEVVCANCHAIRTYERSRLE